MATLKEHIERAKQAEAQHEASPPPCADCHPRMPAPPLTSAVAATVITTVYAPTEALQTMAKASLLATKAACGPHRRFAAIDDAPPEFDRWCRMHGFEVLRLDAPRGQHPRMRHLLAKAVATVTTPTCWTIESDALVPLASVREAEDRLAGLPADVAGLELRSRLESGADCNPTAARLQGAGRLPKATPYAAGLLETVRLSWSATLWRTKALQAVPWHALGPTLGAVDIEACDRLAKDGWRFLIDTEHDYVHYPHTYSSPKTRQQPATPNPALYLPRPSLSVVIPACNEGDEIRRTVQSVIDGGDATEILVVDDASTDGSCRDLPCIVIRNDRRAGVDASRNRGIAAATGDVLVLLDGHMRVPKGGLKELARLAVEKQAFVMGACQGTVSGQVSCGADVRFHHPVKEKGRIGVKWHSPPATEPERCTSFMGASYTAPKALWEKVGGFRTTAGLYGYSEEDLAAACYFMDIPIWCHPGVVCEHKYRDNDDNINRPHTEWDVVANAVRSHRILFTAAVFEGYWLPVFRRLLPDALLQEVLGEPGLAEAAEAFRAKKRRTDAAFFEDCLGVPYSEAKAWLSSTPA